MTKTKGKIIEKKQIAPTVMEVSFELEETFDWIPGQYVNVGVLKPFRRPYSILSMEGNILKLIVGIREPGVGADFFWFVEVGTETEVMGPLGRFAVQDTYKQKVFISSGTGIVPFIPMIRKYIQDDSGRKVKLFQGLRYRKDQFGYSYIADLIESGKVELTRCLSRDEMIEKTEQTLERHGSKKDFGLGEFVKLQRVTAFFEGENSPELDYSNTEFYVCGSNQMVKDMKNILQGKRAENIFVENYG